MRWTSVRAPLAGGSSSGGGTRSPSCAMSPDVAVAGTRGRQDRIDRCLVLSSRTLLSRRAPTAAICPAPPIEVVLERKCTRCPASLLHDAMLRGAHPDRPSLKGSLGRLFKHTLDGTSVDTKTPKQKSPDSSTGIRASNDECEGATKRYLFPEPRHSSGRPARSVAAMRSMRSGLPPAPTWRARSHPSRGRLASDRWRGRNVSR